MNIIITRGAPIGKHLATICLFVLGFFLSAESHAQSVQPLATATAFNWKSSQDASNILLAQVTVLNQQMPGLTPGTPLYDNTLRRLAYFKSIIMEIGKGVSVAEALELSLPAAATLGFEKEASYTPKVLLKALQNETRVLLTN